MSNDIARIKLREILDSRGYPTIEADVILSNGCIGRASVPSGASVGSKEAVEKRDNKLSRYNYKGLIEVISNAEEFLLPKLIGISADQQRIIDELMIECDNSPNKSNFGANVILAISIATAKAAARALNIPLHKYLGGMHFNLPIPMMNIINGGLHADNDLMIQEFMITLHADNMRDRVRWGAEIYHSLKSLLKEKNFSVNIGDEGGFAPNLRTPEEAIELILVAVQNAGFIAGKDVNLALDIAASEFYQDDKYEIIKGQFFSHHELTNYYQQLISAYPIISIEDGMAEDDHIGWQHLTQALGQEIMLVGDDLFVTNAQLLQDYQLKNIANSILIKPNQVGTLSETIETIHLAKSLGYKTIMSHRSGETEDNYISELSVGLMSDYIKTGAPCRSDRTAKYNQLLRIAELFDNL